MSPNNALHINTLADSILDGDCILFLGAGVNCPPPSAKAEAERSLYPPQGQALARLLLAEVEEQNDSRYSRAKRQADEHARQLRSSLIRHAASLRKVLNAKPQDPHDILEQLREIYGKLRELTEAAPALADGGLVHDLTELTRVTQYIESRTDRIRLARLLQRHIQRGRQPSVLLKALAAMPFKFIITTNYDNFFDQTLRSTPSMENPQTFKQPVIGSYSGNPRVAPPSLHGIKPSGDSPYLYKLHGDFNNPDSIVVTDKDYVEFLVRLSENTHGLPKEIGKAIPRSSILFLGYSLRDQNLRVLLKSIYGRFDGPLQSDASKSFSAHYVVSRSHDEITLDAIRPPVIHPISSDLWRFVHDLSEHVYENCDAKPASLKSAIEAIGGFLS